MARRSQLLGASSVDSHARRVDVTGRTTGTPQGVHVQQDKSDSKSREPSDFAQLLVKGCQTGRWSVKRYRFSHGTAARLLVIGRESPRAAREVAESLQLLGRRMVPRPSRYGRRLAVSRSPSTARRHVSYLLFALANRASPSSEVTSGK